MPTRGYAMLPMVGLGGSAGSIAALQAFFAATPAETGMAFVVVMHLSPDHESMLAPILQRATPMPVHQVNDTVRVEAEPRLRHSAGQDDRLGRRPPDAAPTSTPERGRRVAVDLFFRTLADTHGPHAAAIVLSGADGDGAIGIKRIKERGGLTIAQDPDEAEHAGMPRAAIATGMVDWVLPVAEMPARLGRYHDAARPPQAAARGRPAAGAARPRAPADDRGRAARRAGLPARADRARLQLLQARDDPAPDRAGACRSTASRTCPATWRSCARIPAKPARCCRTC